MKNSNLIICLVFGLCTNLYSQDQEVNGNLYVGRNNAGLTNQHFSLFLKSQGPATNNNYSVQFEPIAGDGAVPANSALRLSTFHWTGSDYVYKPVAYFSNDGFISVGRTVERGRNNLGLTNENYSLVLKSQGAATNNNYSIKIESVAGDGAVSANSALRLSTFHWTGSEYVYKPVAIFRNDGLLDVLGTVRAQEVKVCLNQGCDFVFEKDYNLLSLDELDNFIKQNKHLPDIDPARKMESEGINLSNMNAKLLQKIEEQTLYILELNRQLQELKKEVNKLKK